MAEWNTDVLAELIRRKCACLAGLRDLGRRQLALIGDGDISALLDVLAVKQRSLLSLQQIEASLGPFRQNERCPAAAIGQGISLSSWRSRDDYRSARAATPGSVLPSRNSSEAPPPVET